MHPNHLSLLLRRLSQTQTEELDCTECGSRVPEYVDAVLARQDGMERFHLVRNHLFQCPSCCEEFQALHRLLVLESEWLDAPVQEMVRLFVQDA